MSKHTNGRPRIGTPYEKSTETIVIRATEREKTRYKLIGGLEWFRNAIFSAPIDDDRLIAAAEEICGPPPEVTLGNQVQLDAWQKYHTRRRAVLWELKGLEPKRAEDNV